MLWTLQATDSYSDDATVKEYNKGLTLMKAGYTIYLVRAITYQAPCQLPMWGITIFNGLHKKYVNPVMCG